jgi:hypothetical protein
MVGDAPFLMKWQKYLEEVSLIMLNPSLLKEIAASQSPEQLLSKTEKIVLARDYWGISTDDVWSARIPNNLELKEGELCLPVIYIDPNRNGQDSEWMRHRRNIDGHLNLIRQVYDDEFSHGCMRDHLKKSEDDLVINTASYLRGARFVVLDLLNKSSDLEEGSYWAGTEIFDAVVLYSALLKLARSILVPAFKFGHGVDARQIVLSTCNISFNPYLSIEGVHQTNIGGQVTRPVFRNLRVGEY